MSRSQVARSRSPRSPCLFEEAAQEGRRLLRNFFREEVARRDGNASHIVCPCLPDADWSPHFRVPLSKGTSVAPQREDRTRDATAGEPIFRVVLPVQRGCRAVLLADGVNGYWIAQRSDVGSTHLGVENTRRRTPRRESILNDCIRSCCEETLGQGLRLRQQRPGPKGSHESRIGELPYVLSWHDIEDGKTVNKRRMIQACPATLKRRNPRLAITATMSRAMARFEYGSWSRVEAGQPLCPYPRRSAQTTLNCSANRGATRRHIRWVCGKP